MSVRDATSCHYVESMKLNAAYANIRRQAYYNALLDHMYISILT